MVDYRTFRNDDPPRLAALWNEVFTGRGAVRLRTAAPLERYLYAKPYFDREGLIVAERDGRPVGFAHAGFGPNDDQSALSTDMGTTYMLMLHRDAQDDALADELLARAEAYLRDRGSKVIYCGGIRPLDAFYLGLYGGSELPGVLATHAAMIDATRRGGYRDPESQAFIESWFGKLKEREVWLNEYETLDEARDRIGGYVDRYHHRPHSGLNYRTPFEVRETWEDLQKIAA